MRVFVSPTLCALLCVLAGAVVGLGQGLPETRPEFVGVSAKALESLTQFNSKLISENKMPGAVTVVARHGKVAYFETVGMRDREAGLPMAPDTIFRIASMSKPIASIAVMILCDDGKLHLDDPLWEVHPRVQGVDVSRCPRQQLPQTRRSRDHCQASPDAHRWIHLQFL